MSKSLPLSLVSLKIFEYICKYLSKYSLIKLISSVKFVSSLKLEPPFFILYYYFLI